MAGWKKHVAFDITPEWWPRMSSSARQLIVAAAGVLVPQRADVQASVFAVGNSVFAYDIEVPEDVERMELERLRERILEQLAAARDLLPFGSGGDASDLVDTARWFMTDENGAC